MPEWPSVRVIELVSRRTERATVVPGTPCDTMGVRWYGKGAYLRRPSRPQAKSLAVAREGDFVFCRIDSQNGPFAVVPADLDGALVTNEFPLYAVDEDRVDANFLVLCFTHGATRARIDKVREGRDGRARWKEEDFENWRVPLPPLDIQRKIARVAAGFDSVVGALEAEVTQARTARAALLDRLIGDLGGEAVTAMTLRDVADWSSGGTPKADNPAFYNGSIPWAVIGDVRGRYIGQTTRTITESGLESIGGVKKVVPAGAVLVTMYGTIANSAITSLPMATNQAICRGVPRDLVSAEYLRLWVSAHRAAFVALGDGKTQQNISKEKVESFPIVVPGRDAQDALVAVMDTVDDQVDALINETNRTVVGREALIASLLSRTIEVSSGDTTEFG